ncbi:hypothetical protein [Vibrio mediterranei]|uniref:hypothetical protein n=1 Tax=Vibrio mediterranei TaxID=689 RepID=UPI0040692FC7
MYKPQVPVSQQEFNQWNETFLARSKLLVYVSYVLLVGTAIVAVANFILYSDGYRWAMYCLIGTQVLCACHMAVLYARNGVFERVVVLWRSDQLTSAYLKKYRFL